MVGRTVRFVLPHQADEHITIPKGAIAKVEGMRVEGCRLEISELDLAVFLDGQDQLEAFHRYAEKMRDWTRNTANPYDPHVLKLKGPYVDGFVLDVIA